MQSRAYEVVDKNKITGTDRERHDTSRTAHPLVDMRPEAIAQRKLKVWADNSESVKQLRAMHALANAYTSQNVQHVLEAAKAHSNTPPSVLQTRMVVQRTLDDIANEIESWFGEADIKYIIGGSFSSYKHGSGIEAGDLDIYVQKFEQAVALLKKQGFQVTEETAIAATLIYRNEQVQILQKEVELLTSEKIDGVSVPPYEAVVNNTASRPTIRKKEFNIMAGLLSQFMEKGPGEDEEEKVARIRNYLAEMQINLENTKKDEWVSEGQRQAYVTSLARVIENKEDILSFFLDEVDRLDKLVFQATTAASSHADAEIEEAGVKYENEFEFDDDLYVKALVAIYKKYSHEDNIIAKLQEAGEKIIGDEFDQKFKSHC